MEYENTFPWDQVPDQSSCSMDCEDCLAELEAMARAGEQPELTYDHGTIARWSLLFHYNPSEAEQKLRDYRKDLTRQIIQDNVWEMVAAVKMAEGHDRESYAYSLTLLQQESRKRNARAEKAPDTGTYMFKLEGPFSSPYVLRNALRLDKAPKVYEGRQFQGLGARFCEVTGVMKQKIEEIAEELHPGYTPFFFRCNRARKELSYETKYPTLGIDSNLPQHRPDWYDPLASPHQLEYPVMYFFYGSLLKRKIFEEVTGVEPDYCPGRLLRGKLKRWGEYKALVDGEDGDVVMGAAVSVTQEMEDCLRWYETERYEVVRCEMELGHEREKTLGLVFRFRGGEAELKGKEVLHPVKATASPPLEEEEVSHAVTATR